MKPRKPKGSKVKMMPTSLEKSRSNDLSPQESTANDSKEENKESKSIKKASPIKVFFSDPKNIFSVVAILISIASLFYTNISQREQNKKWDALNLARVELMDQGFITWKELSADEVTSTRWGYQPTIFQHIENRVYTGRYRLMNALVLLDLTTKERVPNSINAFTVEGIDREIVRLGLLGQPEKAAVSKLYQIAFDLKNLGPTPATNIRINISVSSSIEGLNGDLFVSDQDVSLPPSGTMNAPATFYLPLYRPLQGTLTFNIKVSYKRANGEQTEQDILVSYDANRNFWHLGW